MSLATQYSSSSRKIFYLRKKPYSTQKISIKKNIFDLTGQQSEQQKYSEINSPQQSNVKSRQYSQISLALSSSPSKHVSPSKQILLPIITESKYIQNQKSFFTPSSSINNHIRRNKFGQENITMSIPKYLRDLQTIDSRNIQKMRQYNKKWKKSIQDRMQKNMKFRQIINEEELDNQKQLKPKQISLLNRSEEKSQVYKEMHNKLLPERKRKIQFEKILRNEHLKHYQSMQEKGKKAPHIMPLKGHGGSVRSLFEEMFVVEQVYKFDKDIHTQHKTLDLKKINNSLSLIS